MTSEFRTLVRQLRNSYLTPRLPSRFHAFYYSRVHENANFFLKAFFYLLKRLGLIQAEVLTWTEIDSPNSHRRTSQYLSLQPQDYLLLNEFCSRITNKELPVLDFGCNTGSYTNELCVNGFKKVYGLDISEAAISRFAENFPSCPGDPIFVAQPAEIAFPALPDRFFAGLVSRGAVIELVPAGFNIVKHLCRIADQIIALRIDEDGHSTPRLYEHEFARYGFILSFLKRNDGYRDSLMVFERWRH